MHISVARTWPALLLATMLVVLPAVAQAPGGFVERYRYGVEWRLIRAGNAQLEYTHKRPAWEAKLGLQSAGLVSKLYRVDDRLTVNIDERYCTESTFLHAEEGNRRRETSVTFDQGRSRINYLERDLLKNATINAKELDAKGCVHDILSALLYLRALRLEPGKSVVIQISDGKKLVQAKIEAQEREQLKTPAGTFRTIRYEAFLFNGVLYARSGRLHVWLSEDDRRIPVQFRVRLQFTVGTITLQLEKEGV